jgi:hypothetical protein
MVSTGCGIEAAAAAAVLSMSQTMMSEHLLKAGMPATSHGVYMIE